MARVQTVAGNVHLQEGSEKKGVEFSFWPRGDQSRVLWFIVEIQFPTRKSYNLTHDDIHTMKSL